MILALQCPKYAVLPRQTGDKISFSDKYNKDYHLKSIVILLKIIKLVNVVSRNMSYLPIFYQVRHNFRRIEMANEIKYLIF